ncbi:MAG: DNA gyrase C-terminal beta-propeller domain-containing protein, partial [Dictyoglomus turgidum]
TYELDETSRQSKGIAIKEYLNIENEERITEIISLSELPKNLYFFFITSKGIVKKTPVEEFENVRKSGIYAIKIGEGDFLVNVFLTSGNNEIIIFTRKGNAIRFHEKDTRPMGRVAQGVIGIKLRKDDSVIGGVILQESKQIVLVTKYGIGKRVNPQEFSTQKRGGIGIRAIKITSKTGDLIGVKNVSENDEILISTKKGQIIRIPVNNIPILSRNSQGVKLVKLNEDDSVVSMDLVENET